MLKAEFKLYHNESTKKRAGKADYYITGGDGEMLLAAVLDLPAGAESVQADSIKQTIASYYGSKLKQYTLGKGRDPRKFLADLCIELNKQFLEISAEQDRSFYGAVSLALIKDSQLYFGSVGESCSICYQDNLLKFWIEGDMPGANFIGSARELEATRKAIREKTHLGQPGHISRPVDFLRLDLNDDDLVLLCNDQFHRQVKPGKLDGMLKPLSGKSKKPEKLLDKISKCINGKAPDNDLICLILDPSIKQENQNTETEKAEDDSLAEIEKRLARASSKNADKIRADIKTLQDHLEAISRQQEEARDYLEQKSKKVSSRLSPANGHFSDLQKQIDELKNDLGTRIEQQDENIRNLNQICTGFRKSLDTSMKDIVDVIELLSKTMIGELREIRSKGTVR